MSFVSKSSGRFLLVVSAASIGAILAGAAFTPAGPTATQSAYARPVRVERENVSQSGALADSVSYIPTLSRDGRYVLFFSFANNLTPAGSGGNRQIFLRDRTNGAVELISIAADGSPGNGDCIPAQWPAPPAITPDGRYVAFSSGASNLVPNDTNGWNDVFVRDRVAGTTERVSVATDGSEGPSPAAGASVSADGRFVAFHTTSRLVASDTTPWSDIYVRDRVAGTTERISYGPDPINQFDSWDPVITPDGRYVAFHSGSNFVSGDGNGQNDVYVRDRQTGAIERISVGSDGTSGNGAAFSPSISDDGRYVAFGSASTNLVPRDGKPSGKTGDAYVRDRLLGTTERVSVTSEGVETNENSGINSANGDYMGAVEVSADGRSVSFSSWSSNIVAGDANQTMDVYLYDRETAATERVSVTDSGGDPEAGATFYAMSPGGRYFAMQSESGNMMANDPGPGIFVHDHGSAVGILDLSATPSASTVAVSGRATFTGAVISRADDPINDGGAANGGTELSGASLSVRPELDDMMVRVMAGAASPGIFGTPGLVYGMRFTANGVGYEVRMDGAQLFTLSQCTTVCTTVGLLRGGVGTMGWEARAAVPLSILGLPASTALTGLRAFVGPGDALSGSPNDIDSVTLPDTTIPGPGVKLGIAAAGTVETQVVFNASASLTNGNFSGTLNTCALPAGNYDVWARACLGQTCGASSVPAQLGAPTCTPTPVPLNTVVSRKTHGSTGDFDVDLPLTGAPGIECRSGGSSGNYTIVFTFGNNLTSVGSASITSGTGSVSSSAIDSNDAHNDVVNLTGVSNAQTITVSLTNVNDSAGNFSASVPITMSVLAGDTTGDGHVNSADIAQTKSQSGQSVAAANFREDVTVDGNVNSADIALAKSKSGTALSP